MLISQQFAAVALTDRENGSLGFTRHTFEVVRSLRALRDRVEIDKSAAPLERREVATSLEALAAYDDRVGRPTELSRRLDRLRQQWAALEPAARSGPAIEASLATASSVFDSIDDRTAQNADSDAAAADLIDAYSVQIPTLATQTDTAKLVLVRSGGGHGLGSRVAFALAIGKARRVLEMAARDIANATRVDVRLTTVEEALTRVDRSLSEFVLLDDRVAYATISVRNARALGDATLRSVDAAERALAVGVARRLDERAARERRKLSLLRVETLLAFAVAIGFSFLLGRSIRDRDRRELSRARSDADRLARELDRQRRLEALAVTDVQLRAVFDRSSIGVAILDRDGTVLRSNRALAEMLDSVDARRIGIAHPEFPLLLAGEIESFVTEVEGSDTVGPRSWFEATVSLVRDEVGAPRFALSMLKDVTERKRVEDRLRYEATHDLLSGLPNRNFFQERLRHAYFSGSGFGQGIGAVLFVDLDEFKFVNDSLGHSSGDRVLVAAGERLRQTTAAGDCIARFGGDEFAVFLPARESRGEIYAVVDAIGRALANPVLLEGNEVVITASIGVAIVHEHYHSVEEILRDADTAMYHAKASGRARSIVFDSSMHDDASRRFELATQLRRALDRGQLMPHYQPVISFATGRIESFEALLRWEHPEIGPISPADFIPVAEEIGLIVPIGRFVLETAVAQFAEWKRASPEHRAQRISVNASVREIVQTDYVEFVETIVRRYGLVPGELILEITESAILSSGKFSFRTLERLKAIGVGLAIDDFGTGYSSLRYLQQFPFDQLKIDRSFVGGADGQLASEPIVAMLISLAHACGVSIVAEGVETRAQADRLRALGCTNAQGYLYGAATRAPLVPALFESIAKAASSA